MQSAVRSLTSPGDALPFLVPIIVGLGIWFCGTPQGLNPQAWQLFAIFVATIVGIVLKPLPMGAVALCSMTAAIITGALDPSSKGAVSKALAGFGHPVPWLAVLAFFIARGFIKTGLGQRIAYLFIRLLGKRTLGLSYGLAITDLILAPAMPSITARGGGIIYPIVNAISINYGSQPNQPSAKRIGHFLMASAFQVNVITAAMFLTGMAGNAIAANMAAEMGIEISWTTWALAALVPGLLSLFAVPLSLYLIYPPEIKATPGATDFAISHLQEMGPVSRNEWVMLLTFFLLLVLWIGGDYFQVHTIAAAFLGVCLLLVSGVLDYGDIQNEKAAWDTLLWMSILIALAGHLNQLGFISWMTTEAKGHITGIPWELAFVLLSAFFLYSHYLFASASGHTVAMMLPLLGVGIAIGVPPMMMALSLCFIGNLFGGLTHYSIGPAPIFFGAGYNELSDWWKMGFLASVINLVIWLGAGSLWWKWLGYW
ncbi:anion permease [Endozoicomonadaceae bacterium StTr2]